MSLSTLWTLDSDVSDGLRLRSNSYLNYATLEFLPNNKATLFDLDKVEINNLGSEELRNSSQWFIDMSFSSP